ncbi:hypothetical protein LY78DRAFT_494339 [Colletotrichum sublineola]|nr:hypothetical protein LY78DRAFT_494339 [Colletotrichum sublineola]
MTSISLPKSAGSNCIEMVGTSSTSPDYGDGQIKGPILVRTPPPSDTEVLVLKTTHSQVSPSAVTTFPGLSFPIVRKRNGYTDTMDVWLTHLHSLPLSPMARGVAMGNQQAVAKSPFALPILLSLAQGPAPRLGARGEPAANLHFQFWDGSTNARSSPPTSICRRAASPVMTMVFLTY